MHSDGQTNRICVGVAMNYVQTSMLIDIRQLFEYVEGVPRSNGSYFSRIDKLVDVLKRLKT